MMSKHRLAGSWILGCISLLLAAPGWAEVPRNVIFMIGDGMGPNHVRAGGMFMTGSEGTLCFESLPYQGEVTTYSASSSVTDSAASATAMATGFKVNNGVIAMAYPGNGAELQTLLEFFKSRSASTGLVTSDGMTGATPAGFGAHEPSRNNSSQIAGDYLNQTRPNVLLGGGEGGMSTSAAAAAGYTVVTDRAAMQAINTSIVNMLSGQFGSGSMPYEYDGVGSLPHLSEMTATALDILDNDPDGFFLMVESGNIDHAAHSNDIARMVPDVVEFHHTVQVAIDWAAGRTDTLLLVTADHETGGLSILQNNGQGQLPTVSWSTTGHTATNVPVYAWGVNAEYITGTLDNTQLNQIVKGPQAIILVSPPDLTRHVPWGHNVPAPADTFTIRNAGLSPCMYSISSDVGWVWTDPATGTCTTEIDTIELVYDAAALPPGMYVGHLEVRDDDASNSPQFVTVTLFVDPVPSDFDHDDDVDQSDFGHLQECLGTFPIAPGCENADLDRDTRVDQDDLVLLQQCLSGANVLPDPLCID